MQSVFFFQSQNLRNKKIDETHFNLSLEERMFPRVNEN